MTTQLQLPRIVVFSLGGTIASTKSPTVGDPSVAPRLSADDLIRAVPELKEAAQLEPVAFRQSGSGDLTLRDIVELASEITTRVEAGAAGVVVTQGTDTIEETSFALDLLLDAVIPVVVTGAMRNPTVAGADGPANLLAAVQVAASPLAAGLGCLVVVNDEIHAARFVRKTHTTSPSTFRSMSTGPLGWIVEGRPRIVLRPAARAHVGSPFSGQIPAVALVKMCLGEDARLLEQVEALGYAGLVIEAFGGGHVPARTVSALERLAGRLPVVLASRTGDGDLLTQTYGFPGGERDLLARGLVSAGYLDGPKSRVLLSLLLAQNKGREDIRQVFAQWN